MTLEGFRDYVGTASFGDVVLLYPREAPLARQYRPAKEVLSDRAIASLKGQPVTDDHPDNPQRAVTPENASKLTKGVVLDAWREGNKLRVKVRIYDAGLMQRIAAGKVDLSCGYDCDTVAESGTTRDGRFYDAVQRNHIYNHLAFVDIPRAPGARITQDSTSMDEIITLILSGQIPLEDLAKIEQAVAEAKAKMAPAPADPAAPPADPAAPPAPMEDDAAKPPAAPAPAPAPDLAADMAAMKQQMADMMGKLDALAGKKGDGVDIDATARKVAADASKHLRSIGAARTLAAPVLGAKVDAMDDVNAIHAELVAAVFPEQKPTVEAALKNDQADVLAALAETARSQFNKRKTDSAADHLGDARSKTDHGNDYEALLAQARSKK